MKILILAVTLLISQIQSECDTGCLKCNKSNICVFCDLTNFYYLKDSQCVKAELENCESINLQGICKGCKRGFFLDQKTFKCEKVLSNVENCDSYENSNSCKICSQNYYLKQKFCVPVPMQIDGCEQYSGSNQCEKCRKDRVLSLDRQKCEFQPQLKNCQNFSTFNCKSCKTGFIKDSNKYYNEIFTLNSPQQNEFLASMLNQSQMEEIGYLKKHICVKSSIENCEIFESYQKCKKCKINYLLGENGKCSQFKRQMINNCQSYLSAEVCEKCSEGYFLQSFNLCFPITKIEHCKSYDNSASSSKCSECEGEYYLLNNVCTLRQESKTISKCLKYDFNGDKCGECEKTFQLTGDNLMCLQEISQCIKYDQSTTKSSTNLICIQCDKHHYLQGNKCLQGTVENCEIYETATNVCKECKNEYFVTSNKCQKHSTLNNCEKYDPVNQGKCKECNYYNQSMDMINQCQEADKIENCEIYSEKSVCGECKEGYYLTDNKCEVIDVNLNCKKFDGSKCTWCKNNSVLFNGKCILPGPIQLVTCAQHNMDQQSQSLKIEEFECKMCREGHSVKNYKNNFICLPMNHFQVIIENCISYQGDQCLRCTEGHFLSNNLCQPTCLNAVQDLEIKKINQNYLITKTKICSEEFPNCSKRGYFENLSTGCLQCKEGTIPFIDGSSTNFLIDQKHPFSTLSSLICQSLTGNSLIGTVNSSGLISNCQYYHSIGSNTFGCFKCNFGYYGEISNHGSIGYLKQCQKNLECDTKVQYQGIGGLFEKFISCHSCLNKNNLVFFVVNQGLNLNKLEKFTAYNLSSNDWDSLTGGFSNMCVSPTASVFKIENDQFTFPINCLIGGLNVASAPNSLSSTKSKTNGGLDTQLATFCSVCKPSFKPNYFDDSLKIPISCEKIQNCHNSNWVNACSQCTTNFTYKYNTSSQQIEYDECVSHTLPNCYAIEIDSQGTKKCKYCQKGYSFNEDQICQKYQVTSCKENMFVFQDLAKINEIRHRIYISPVNGCEQCEQEISQFQSNDFMACTPDSYVSYDKFTSETNFVSNCQNYSGNSLIPQCAICKANFVLDTSHKHCLPSNNIPHCKIALNETICLDCLEGFAVVSGKCKIASLKNCIKYLPNPEQLEQHCLTCDQGYYLNQGKCLKGNLTGCLEYSINSSTECTKCGQGFTLLQNTNQTYCFPINSNLNCKQISTKLIEKKYECEICSEGFFKKILENPQTQCIAFNQILHCVEYQKYDLSNPISYYCKKCKEGYYSGGLDCKERSYQSEVVEEYNNGLDQALKCKKDYFLDFDGKCVANPAGKEGCIRYSSENVCSGCAANMYLQSNQCLKIKDNEKIENCVYYTTKSHCISCEEGYYANGGICQKSFALDCSSYASVTSCSSCKSGFGLKQENNLIHCVLVNQPNCLYYTSMHPWDCLLCNQNYFPNSTGGCSPVQNEINQCLYYESATQCRQCLPGSILSLDKSQCLLEFQNFLDTDCVSYEIQQYAQCSLCQSGFYLKGENCERCPSQDDQEGCFTCNPLSPTECVLCSPGYFQSKTGKCIKISQPQKTPEISHVFLIPLLFLLINLQ